MGYSSVALPAFPFLVDHCYGGFMAADAVGLEHLSSMRREGNPFRNLTGMKYHDILDPIYRLPDVMHHLIIVRQVTGYTGYPSMGPRMDPCFVFSLHHMALLTVTWRIGECPGMIRECRNEKREKNKTGEKRNCISIVSFFDGRQTITPLAEI